MLKRNVDLTALPPSKSLVDIYSGWQQSFHFAYYCNTSTITTIGSQGTNRVGTSIGVDSSGNSVLNTRSPWGYYTAYSQRATSKWAAKACVNQDVTALHTCLLGVEFAYKFQDYQGKNLIGSTYNPTPYFDGRLPTFATAITSASTLAQLGDMSFFLADLQHTLHILKSSSWFNTSSATASHRGRLAILLPYIKISVDWLADPTIISGGLTRWQTLLQNDSVAPNRICQQGVAYYGMGAYFNSTYLLNLGRSLIQYALKYQMKSYADASRSAAGIITKPGGTYPYMAWARTDTYNRAAPLGWGFFSEQGGSDSSYNGTNVMFLLRLYPVILGTDVAFKKQVWSAIVQAFRWQIRMLQSTGEFSQQDNTRVYNGGENYNGKPKVNDYLECLFGFEFYATITNDQSVRDACELMLRFYSVKTFTTTGNMSLYTFGQSEILNGNILLNTDDLYLAIVQTAGTRNAPYHVNLTTDQYLSSIPSAAFADAPTPLSNAVYDPVGGNLTTPTAFFDLVQAMPFLVQIGGIVLYKYTGDSTTSTLIAYSSNLTGLPYGPQGVDINIAFANQIAFNIVGGS